MDHSDPTEVESPTVLIDTIDVRRVSTQLDALADRLSQLIEEDGAVVDLSRHDRHANIIEIRATETRRADTP